ncbi:MAG: putative assembly protein [Inoviridae sp.]|nr:MAG: putative assembly protein [Inoviridae sp.]
MINAIVGRPRAGKSYESVLFHIIPSAAEGRLVVTNIPVNLASVVKFYSQEVADRIIIVKANFTDYGMIRPFSKPEDFTKYDWKNEKGQGPLFVVDEAHLCLGSTANREVLEYLSLHGHYGHDIIIVTQSPKKLHRDLKDMIEVCWRCVKKSVFGDDTHYIKKTYHGVSARNEDFVHEEEREYKKQYFQFYQSHTQSSAPVDEAVSKDINATLFPRKKLIICMLVVGTITALYLGKKMMYQSIESTTQVTQAEPVTKSIPSIQPSSPQQAIEQKLTYTKQSNQTERTDFKPTKSFHPFYKVQLHADGYSEYTMGGRLYKDIYFVASQNGQNIFTIGLPDLKLAGYDVSVYGKCAVLVEYGDYQDWITCDSPVISADVGVSPSNENDS